MSLALPVGAFAGSLEDAERAVRERSFESAVRIYRGLAEAGEVEAQVQLAALYRSGRGVEADPGEAARWLRAAAEQGRADAQYGLATMLEHARGVPRDLANAGRWYRAAAAKGHAAAQRRLRDAQGSRAPNGKGAESLVAAAERGDTARLMQLLAATSADPGPALLAAAARGRSETVGALLARGADPDVAGAHQETPLHLAARLGDVESVGRLLRAGAGPDRSDDRGATPLHAAARAGRLAVVERLVAGGASSRVGDAEGRTALDLAERGGHRRVAQVLQRAGALRRRSPDKVDRRRAALWANGSERSTLATHARRGDEAAVVALVQAGITSEARAGALREAAAHGHLAIVQALVDRASANAVDPDSGATPLGLAARAGHAPVVRLLLSWGTSPETGQPLVAAARGGHLEVVEQLLGVRGDPRGMGIDAALRAAIASDEGPVVDVLFAAGADPTRPGEAGETGLCVAAALPDASLLVRLLGGRAVDGQVCEGGEPLLHRSARSAEAVRILLGLGAAPDVLGTDGTTALMVAAARGNEGSTRALLEAEADPNARGPRRRTALMIAAERGHGAVVDRLIAANARADLRDAAGDTAAELAARAGHDGIRVRLDAIPAKPWF